MFIFPLCVRWYALPFCNISSNCMSKPASLAKTQTIPRSRGYSLPFITLPKRLPNCRNHIRGYISSIPGCTPSIFYYPTAPFRSSKQVLHSSENIQTKESDRHLSLEVAHPSMFRSVTPILLGTLLLTLTLLQSDAATPSTLDSTIRGSHLHGNSFPHGAPFKRGASFRHGDSFKRGASFKNGRSFKHGGSFAKGGSFSRGKFFPRGKRHGTFFSRGPSFPHGHSSSHDSSCNKSPCPHGYVCTGSYPHRRCVQSRPHVSDGKCGHGSFRGCPSGYKCISGFCRHLSSSNY